MFYRTTGEPLHPAILWCDARNAAQVSKCRLWILKASPSWERSKRANGVSVVQLMKINRLCFVMCRNINVVHISQRSLFISYEKIWRTRYDSFLYLNKVRIVFLQLFLIKIPSVPKKYVMELFACLGSRVLWPAWPRLSEVKPANKKHTKNTLKFLKDSIIML